MTCLASIHPRDRQFFHGAAHSVPEINLDLVFQVAAWLVFRFRSDAAPAAKELAEKVAETSAAGCARSPAEIKSAKIKIYIRLTRAWPSPRIAARRQVIAVEAVLVVHLPLFRVGEHVVGFLDLFEFFLRGLVTGIQVGVVLARQLAKRRANILHARFARHA